jgi:hypothetical protein
VLPFVVREERRRSFGVELDRHPIQGTSFEHPAKRSLQIDDVRGPDQ